jgi:hypothetical protein
MEAAVVPGVLAVIRDGTVGWHGAFGHANAQTGAQVTDASVFEAASLTKPLFAYAVPTPGERFSYSGEGFVYLGAVVERRPSRQPRRAASMVAMSTFVMVIMASKARLASAPPAASASVSARGVICQERPQRSVHLPTVRATMSLDRAAMDPRPRLPLASSAAAKEQGP